MIVYEFCSLIGSLINASLSAAEFADDYDYTADPLAYGSSGAFWSVASVTCVSERSVCSVASEAFWSTEFTVVFTAVLPSTAKYLTIRLY